jgi:hypothetical protein
MKPIVNAIEEIVLSKQPAINVAKVALSGRDLSICRRNAEIRQRQFGQANQSSFRYHLQGIVGEAAVLRAFGAPLRFLHRHEDFGIDLMIGTVAVDVKCTSGLLQNCNLMVDADKEIRADVLMLARTDDPAVLANSDADYITVGILGWMDSATFKDSAETFEIRGVRKRRLMNHALIPLDCFAGELEVILED